MVMVCDIKDREIIKRIQIDLIPHRFTFLNNALILTLSAYEVVPDKKTEWPSLF